MFRNNLRTVKMNLCIFSLQTNENFIKWWGLIMKEKTKELSSALYSAADALRSKMDANEYKDYLLGIVFYKYLSDSFLIKVYDMICDDKPKSLKEALDA